MKLEDEFKKVDLVYSQLRNLRNEMLNTIKKSEKAFNIKSMSPKQLDRITANLNFQCLHLEKCRKQFWKAFLENQEIFDVSLEEREYNPSEFHKYKF